MSGPSNPDPISEATQDSFPSTMTDSLPTGSSSSHSLLSDSSSRVSPSGDGPPSARRKKDGTQQNLNTIRHHGKDGQHRPSSTNRHDDSGMALDASEMEAANDVEELPFARPPKFKPNQFSGPQQRLPIHAEDFADLEDLASLQDERPQKLNSVSHQHQKRSGRGHGGGRHRKDTKQSDGTNTGVNAENGNHSPVHEVHSGKTTDTGKDDPNVQSQMPVNSSKEVDSFPLDGQPAQVKIRARQRPTVLEQNAPPSQGQGIRPFHDADNSLPGGLGRQQVQEKPNVEVPATSTRRKPEEDREVRRPVLVPQMGPPAAVNSTTIRSPTDQGANVTPPKRRNGLPQASKQHFESVESQRQRMSTPVGDLEGPRPTPNRAHAARRNETPRSSRTPRSGHVQRREHASRRDIEPRRGEIRDSEQPSRPLREEDLCVSAPRVPSRQSNVSRVRRTRNQDRSRSSYREVNVDLLRPRSGHLSKDMNLSSICEMIYGLEVTEAESRKTIDELRQQKQDLEQQVYSVQQTHRSLVDKSLQYEKSYNEIAADSQQRAAQMKHQENRLNRVLEQRDHLRAESSKMRAELESSRVKQSELQEDVIRAEAEIEKEAGRNRKHREETSKQTELELMALKEEQKVTIDGLKAQLEAKRDAYENEKRALKDLQVDFATLKEHLSGAETKAKGLDSQLTEIKQSNDRFQKIEAIMAKMFTGIENLAEKSDQADVVPPQIVKK
ncbi:hypothetical protein CKAH01_04179 [Colletotrichum kahawae]|uniref:Uncharacterized protein n=1 Tax=Colletotrichum kahawae TaxID=34407 RepID=A0AAE0DAI4_COLKA|nr:hypothetical protein CKAH01_04179 [Colletotrichum kahawae]